MPTLITVLSGGLRPPATISQPFGLQLPNLIQVSQLYSYPNLSFLGAFGFCSRLGVERIATISRKGAKTGESRKGDNELPRSQIYERQQIS